MNTYPTITNGLKSYGYHEEPAALITMFVAYISGMKENDHLTHFKSINEMLNSAEQASQPQYWICLVMNQQHIARLYSSIDYADISFLIKDVRTVLDAHPKALRNSLRGIPALGFIEEIYNRVCIEKQPVKNIKLDKFIINDFIQLSKVYKKPKGVIKND